MSEADFMPDTESGKRFMVAYKSAGFGRVTWGGPIDGDERWFAIHWHPENVPCSEWPSLHDPVLAVGDDERLWCTECQAPLPYLLDLVEHDGMRFWCASCALKTGRG